MFGASPHREPTPACIARTVEPQARELEVDRAAAIVIHRVALPNSGGPMRRSETPDDGDVNRTPHRVHADLYAANAIPLRTRK
jgi:hypothetical protein